MGEESPLARIQRLYCEQRSSFANAQHIGDMSTIGFYHLLGKQQIPRQYDAEDDEKDMEKQYEASRESPC